MSEQCGFKPCGTAHSLFSTLYLDGLWLITAKPLRPATMRILMHHQQRVIFTLYMYRQLFLYCFKCSYICCLTKRQYIPYIFIEVSIWVSIWTSNSNLYIIYCSVSKAPLHAVYVNAEEERNKCYCNEYILYTLIFMNASCRDTSIVGDLYENEK